MFSHIMVGSNDIARSKKFYDAVFGVMGVQPATPDARGRLAYAHNGGRFMVSKPIDGQPANDANGGTIGFTMSSPEQAKAWHDAGRRQWRHLDRGPARHPPRAPPARCTSPICATPTATSCSAFAACRAELSPIETGEDRPSRAVLPPRRFNRFAADSGARPRRPPAPRSSPASSSGPAPQRRHPRRRNRRCSAPPSRHRPRGRSRG